jgi:hypothetical protein
MYIFSLTQFLSENETLRNDLTEEGKEMAGFLTLLVETATKEYPVEKPHTNIPCVEKDCDGRIGIGVEPINEFIFWLCNKCGREGVLQGWSKSKWDKR